MEKYEVNGRNQEIQVYPAFDSMSSPSSAAVTALDKSGYDVAANGWLPVQEHARDIRRPHLIQQSPVSRYSIIPAHRRAELLSQQAARAAVAAGFERDLAWAAGKTATPEKVPLKPLAFPHSYQVE